MTQHPYHGICRGYEISTISTPELSDYFDRPFGTFLALHPGATDWKQATLFADSLPGILAAIMNAIVGKRLAAAEVVSHDNITTHGNGCANVHANVRETVHG